MLELIDLADIGCSYSYSNDSCSVFESLHCITIAVVTATDHFGIINLLNTMVCKFKTHQSELCSAERRES